MKSRPTSIDKSFLPCRVRGRQKGRSCLEGSRKSPIIRRRGIQTLQLGASTEPSQSPRVTTTGCGTSTIVSKAGGDATQGASEAGRSSCGPRSPSRRTRRSVEKACTTSWREGCKRSEWDVEVHPGAVHGRDWRPGQGDRGRQVLGGSMPGRGSRERPELPRGRRSKVEASGHGHSVRELAQSSRRTLQGDGGPPLQSALREPGVEQQLTSSVRSSRGVVDKPGGCSRLAWKRSPTPEINWPS